GRDGHVRFWAIESWGLLLDLTFPDAVEKLSLSCDGSTILLSLARGGLICLDLHGSNFSPNASSPACLLGAPKFVIPSWSLREATQCLDEFLASRPSRRQQQARCWATRREHVLYLAALRAAGLPNPPAELPWPVRGIPVLLPRPPLTIRRRFLVL